MSNVEDQRQLQTALSLHQTGDLAKAAAIYRELIARNPDNYRALCYLGMIEAGAGNFALGKSLMARSLSIEPANIQLLESYAFTLFRSGDYQCALEICQQGFQLDAASAPLTYVSAISLAGLRRFADALRQLDKLLVAQPDNVAVIQERGSVLAQMKRFDDALASFAQVLTLKPGLAEAHLARGNVCSELARCDEALAAYDRALALRPGLAGAWLGRGNVLRELKCFDDALAAYAKALDLEPRFAKAWLGRGNVFFALKRHDDALAAYDQALALSPDLAGAWVGRGNVLLGLNRHGDSLAAYDKALTLEPGLAEAWLGRGNVLTESGRHQDAFAAYDRALALKADLAEAWSGRGNIFSELKRYNEAVAAYDKSLALRPGARYAAGARLLAKLYICDWTSLDEETAQLLAAIRDPESSGGALPLTAIPASPADQLQIAKLNVNDRPKFPQIWRGEAYSHDRIRVAYLSADFHEHPTGHLATGLFEHHDRSRFEVTGISFGPDPKTAVRHRIEHAFDRFIDVKDESERNIADLVRQLEIDIAVDLMGFTQHNRLGVFARRPAPIQVNYFGYIGTMGAEFFDYVIADKIALPFDQQEYFTEKIVHLPDCFLVTDDQQRIAPGTPSRADAGLPADGFVFCSFNNSYKFARPMFEAWMRLLHAVDGGVLWLLQSNEEMVVNLRREARRCGIGGGRIVFAPHVALPEHLARQRLAGLFLDTTPYNAGATAAAALWSGLPVLTVMGETFVGRMAASMLHAVGLPELAVRSLDDYEALACKLATSPKALASMTQKLRGKLPSAPLFDTARFARHIEAAYTTMWERHRSGEPPQAFAVDRTCLVAPASLDE